MRNTDDKIWDELLVELTLDEIKKVRVLNPVLVHMTATEIMVLAIVNYRLELQEK